MTRKIISAFLVLILCFSLVLSVSAEDTAFIVDEFGYLADMELDLLNKQAQTIYEETGIGIFFVFTTEDTLGDYDVSRLTGGMEDYFVMIENGEHWDTFSGGSAATYIDTDAEDSLRAGYDRASTYIDGIRDFLVAASELLPQSAASALPETKERFFYDEADLLTDREEVALDAKLADISAAYNAQVVICTVSSVAGGNVERYIDVLYDTMGFGYGANRDGVLMLVCMDPRQFWTIGNGFAHVAIGNDEIDMIGDAIVSDLSNGNYAAAFEEFAEQCAYYLDGHLNGFPFAFGKNLLICLAIGIALGLIVAFVLKAQLKTVRRQDRANAYVKQNSMKLTAQSDVYLYRTVSRTPKSSGGSSGSGSSGRSKGGRSF